MDRVKFFAAVRYVWSIHLNRKESHDQPWPPPAILSTSSWPRKYLPRKKPQRMAIAEEVRDDTGDMAAREPAEEIGAWLAKVAAGYRR